MTDTKLINPDTYHVKSELGRAWLKHDDLAHISLKIRHLAYPVADLIEDPSNVRKHDDTNLEGIRGAYAKYKQRVLLVVNVRTMVVEKGNGSLRTLRLGGFKFAAVLFVNDDPATATGFAIADNRTAETATWDLPALLGQLNSLKEVGHEVPAIDEAFFDELVSIVGDAGFTPGGDEPGEDTEPDAPPIKAKSELGKVYVLGSHRIMCGDSTNREQVDELLAGDKVQQTNTDPPYGVGYTGTQTLERDSIENDNLGEEGMYELWRDALKIACDVSVDGAVCYAFTPLGLEVLWATLKGFRESGFIPKHTLLWVKDTFVLGRCDYHYKHEGVFYGWKPGAGHYFVEDRTQSTVLEYKRPRRNEEHPTMKPVAMIEKLVTNSSKAGWIVYDPFGGSFST
ncbi:hypothetical protein LCGC14_1320380, partial [marine sediment metagenome]